MEREYYVAELYGPEKKWLVLFRENELAFESKNEEVARDMCEALNQARLIRTADGK